MENKMLKTKVVFDDEPTSPVGTLARLSSAPLFYFKQKGARPMVTDLEVKKKWKHNRKSIHLDEGHGVSDKDLFCACAVVGSIIGVMVMIAIAMWRAL
jgi:hypothetical protein